MYATEANVARWLSSIPDLQHLPLPFPETDRELEPTFKNETRPRKRQKLQRYRHNSIPSPPTSEPLVNTMSSSSRKRSRPDNHDDAFETSSSPAQSDRQINEDTPRASKLIQTQMPEWIPFSTGHGPTPASGTSSASNQSVPASNQSKQSAVSNRSSPSKQFRNAEMNESGFSVGIFSRQPHPESLRKLRLELRDIGAGYSFLPASLESEVRLSWLQCASLPTNIHHC
jgi:hypothetical protein